MRIHWKSLCLSLLPAAALLLGGCGGISASKTVSPLDFLLPGMGGLGGFIKADPPQSQTNASVASVVLKKDTVEVASVR